MALQEENSEKIWKALKSTKIGIKNSKLVKLNPDIYKINTYQTKIPLIPIATLFLKFEENQKHDGDFYLTTHLEQHLSYRLAVLVVDLLIFPILPILLEFKTTDTILFLLVAIFFLALVEKFRNDRLIDVKNCLFELKEELDINQHTEVSSKKIFLLNEPLNSSPPTG